MKKKIIYFLGLPVKIIATVVYVLDLIFLGVEFCIREFLNDYLG